MTINRRRPFVAIVSIVLGLAAGLAAAEAAARLFALAPSPQAAYGNFAPDPYLPFKPQPSSRSTGRTEDFDYDYRHNSLGFRDVERPLAKPAGTFRILGLGDSFTYGVGVAFEDTYLSRLEILLNNRPGSYPRVEIVKAGVPRYFPEPQRMLLERYGIAFQPDLVLVGFLPNDVIDTYFGLEAVSVSRAGYLMSRQARELGAAGMQVYRHSHAGRLLLKRYVDWQVARHYRPRYDEVFQGGGFHERDWRGIEREYETMATIASSARARVVILHIPQKGPWTARSRYPATRLGAWAASHDVGFLDVLPAIERGAVRERLYYDQDGHCTAAGHAIIAIELYRYLVDDALVP